MNHQNIVELVEEMLLCDGVLSFSTDEKPFEPASTPLEIAEFVVEGLHNNNLITYTDIQDISFETFIDKLTELQNHPLYRKGLLDRSFYSNIIDRLEKKIEHEELMTKIDETLED